MGKNELGAALLVVCALLACKKPETRERERAERAGATKAPAAAVAEPEIEKPRVHSFSGAPERTERADVSPLAEALDRLRRNPDKTAEGVDQTGKRTINWRFKPLPGTTWVELARYRSDPNAWRLEVAGVPCSDIGQLGLVVTISRHNTGMPPHFNAEYDVRGGPLDGTVMRVFNQGVDSPRLCTVLPGTRAYWALAEEPVRE
jgi:hypothetical protein